MSETPRTDAHAFGTTLVEDKLIALPRRVVDYDFARQLERELQQAQAELAEQQAVIERLNVLPARVVAMCQKRGWSLHWTHRGAYLHLEASELIEAIRGKRGDPADEAGDVLLVLMSITEYAGISFSEVIANATAKLERLEIAPRYKGEEYSSEALSPTGKEGE